MNFSISRDILNNKYETIISFSSFGSATLTAEKEKQLLENFPVIISYKDITFSEKFDVVSGKIVSSIDLGAELVSLALTQRLIPVDELFQVKYEISTSQILDSEIGTKLNTKDLVCQAKVKLFEEKIIAEITKLIEEARLKDSDFETETPVEITI